MALRRGVRETLRGWRRDTYLGVKRNGALGWVTTGLWLIIALTLLVATLTNLLSEPPLNDRVAWDLVNDGLRLGNQLQEEEAVAVKGTAGDRNIAVTL